MTITVHDFAIRLEVTRRMCWGCYEWWQPLAVVPGCPLHDPGGATDDAS